MSLSLVWIECNMASYRACCSIEIEPRTLNQGQINHARAIAADVVQKMEPNTATSIFVEGLKPLIPTKDKEPSSTSNDEAKVVELQKQGMAMKKPCECACASGLAAIDDSPHQVELKEPLSAPF